MRQTSAHPRSLESTLHSVSSVPFLTPCPASVPGPRPRDHMSPQAPWLGPGLAFPVSDDLASLKESWTAVTQRVPPLGFAGCVSQIQLGYGSCEDDPRGQVPFAHVVLRTRPGGWVGVGGRRAETVRRPLPWSRSQGLDAGTTPRRSCTSERRPGLTVRRYRWRLAGRVLDAQS